MSGEWVTLIRRVPREHLQIILQAERACADDLRFHGRLPQSEASAMVEVTELIYAHYLISSAEHDRYRQMLLDSSRHERREAFEAFDRDGWRCLICGHTGMNEAPGGTLESHHIIPRSCYDDRIRPPDIHDRSNRATLCHRHHEQITNPTEPKWHWRAIAPALLKTIGNHELAAKVEATLKDDPLVTMLEDNL